VTCSRLPSACITAASAASAASASLSLFPSPPPPSPPTPPPPPPTAAAVAAADLAPAYLLPQSDCLASAVSVEEEISVFLEGEKREGHLAVKSGEEGRLSYSKDHDSYSTDQGTQMKTKSALKLVAPRRVC